MNTSINRFQVGQKYYGHGWLIGADQRDTSVDMQFA